MHHVRHGGLLVVLLLATLSVLSCDPKDGKDGRDGAIGPMGPAGPQGEPGLVWRGDWSAATAYAVDDAVGYQGSSYVCAVANTGAPPINTSFWDVLAERGVEGATVMSWRGNWSSLTPYVSGDVVFLDGSSFICVVANTNQQPGLSGSWETLAAKGNDAIWSGGDVANDARFLAGAQFDGSFGIGEVLRRDVARNRMAISTGTDLEWVDDFASVYSRLEIGPTQFDGKTSNGRDVLLELDWDPAPKLELTDPTGGSNLVISVSSAGDVRIYGGNGTFTNAFRLEADISDGAGAVLTLQGPTGTWEVNTNTGAVGWK